MIIPIVYHILVSLNSTIFWSSYHASVEKALDVLSGLPEVMQYVHIKSDI